MCVSGQKLGECLHLCKLDSFPRKISFPETSTCKLRVFARGKQLESLPDSSSAGKLVSILSLFLMMSSDGEKCHLISMTTCSPSNIPPLI